MLSSVIHSVGFFGAVLDLKNWQINLIEQSVHSSQKSESLAVCLRRFDSNSRRLICETLRSGLRKGSLFVRTRPARFSEQYNVLIFWSYQQDVGLHLLIRQTHVDLDHSCFSVDDGNALLCSQAHQSKGSEAFAVPTFI